MRILAAVLLAAALVGCKRNQPAPENPVAPTSSGSSSSAPTGASDPVPTPDAGIATFGGGCFWCTEAVFLRLDGVFSVESGYSGGRTERPTYRQVSAGDTGHAEVVQVRYDPKKTSYEEVLEVFWKTHDPTTKDRQGNDEGSQYRSVIFTHDAEQKRIAEELKAALEKEKVFPAPIVTEIVPFQKFWKAEDYHKDYFANNPTQPYCRAVVAKKVEKFEKIFKDRLKR